MEKEKSNKMLKVKMIAGQGISFEDYEFDL